MCQVYSRRVLWWLSTTFCHCFLPFTILSPKYIKQITRCFSLLHLPHSVHPVRDKFSKPSFLMRFRNFNCLFLIASISCIIVTIFYKTCCSYVLSTVFSLLISRATFLLLQVKSLFNLRKDCPAFSETWKIRYYISFCLSVTFLSLNILRNILRTSFVNPMHLYISLSYFSIGVQILNLLDFDIPNT